MRGRRSFKLANMLGFELQSVVRRRFPNIAVVAISAWFMGLANKRAVHYGVRDLLVRREQRILALSEADFGA